MTRQELMCQEQEVAEFRIQVKAPSGGREPDQTLQVYLNLAQCELMAIKECLKNNYNGIPLKNHVQYLGILKTKDQKIRCLLNFSPIIEKTKKELNNWLIRDLSLRGRVLITEAEGISRLIYAAMALHLDKKLCEEIDKILIDFIWKNKIHYIKKSVIMNSYENGGLNVLDFATLNNTCKVNWLKQIVKNPNSIWCFIPSHILSKLGGIHFFLSCNYNIDKIPAKLAEFHRQAFLSWSLIHKHNYSPHRYYIWNNKDIIYKHKSLYLKHWFDNGIILVDQLFNLNGFFFYLWSFWHSIRFLLHQGTMPKFLGLFLLKFACYLDIRQESTSNSGLCLM